MKKGWLNKRKILKNSLDFIDSHAHSEEQQGGPKQNLHSARKLQY